MVTSSESKQGRQSSEADSISELATFSLDASESEEVPLWLVLLSLSWSPVLLKASPTVPSSGSVAALVGLEGGLIGSCPCGLELGLISDANVDVSPSPCVEVCSLLALTSWESTWVLLSWWSLRKLLEEQSHFFCVGQQWTQQMGSHPRECQQRGYLVREVLEEAEFQLDELDCLRGPEPVSPLSQIQQWSLECPLSVAWQWPALHSYSEGELWRRSTRVAAWSSQLSSPEKRPHERWHLPLWPFVLTISHACWPTWSADCHIFEPTPVFPRLIHIPAGLWPGWYLASVWGLGERPILPLYGCPLLDGDGRPMKGPAIKSGWRGNAPFLSFATKPPRRREMLSTPPLPPPMAGLPWCQSKEVTCRDAASPVEIGWRKPPESRWRKWKDPQGI